MAEPHTLKYFGDGDEHQRRACLQGVRVTAREGKYSRYDHQTGHDCNGSVKNFNIFCGFLNGNILFHIGTESHQNAHSNGQRVEHLPHSSNNGHP